MRKQYHYKTGVITPFVNKFYKQIIVAIAGLFLLSMAMMTLGARASTTAWQQGFEVDTSGWASGGVYGSIDRVASGNDGIDSFEGSWHAVVDGDSSAPYSFFDGSRDTWPGTWTAEIAVYLDTEWDLGSGFDYSVASYNTDGNHRRDFIFHVAKDTSTESLIVAGSNNSNFATRENLETLENHYVVVESGWYKLQHVFRDQSGQLAVDLNLVNAQGDVLFTETRTNATDIIPTVVGGNGYSWFTFIDVPGGLAVDAHQLVLNEVMPPATGEIIAPTANQDVSGEFTLQAVYDDGDEVNDRGVNWAVRSEGMCNSASNNVFGNVDGMSDPYTWDGKDFTATVDFSSVAPGVYCFVFNPNDRPGDNVRETVLFNVVAVEATDPTNQNDCKKGGWANFGFRNQGLCIQFVNTGRDSR